MSSTVSLGTKTIGLIAALVVFLAVPAMAQESRLGAAVFEADTLDVEIAVAKAQAIMDRQEIPLPAVVRFGKRRGEPMKGGTQDEVNATIGLTQSTLETFMGRELFVYGIPVVSDSDEHAHRRLVGRIVVSEAEFDEKVPLVTVQLDPDALWAGSVNDYYLMSGDLGDELVSEDPKPDEMVAIMGQVAGRFEVRSRVADAALDKLVRSSHDNELRSRCRTSIFCVGFPIGRCGCYWDGTEWVCGFPKKNVTQTCVGWCPG